MVVINSSIIRTKRLKVAVLDANYYWTEQLFSACHDFADVLLLRPVDFRAFHKRYGSYFIDIKPQLVAKRVWEQRVCCPPGWLFHYWPLTRCFFASLIRRFQQNHPLIFVFNFPYYYTLAKALQANSIYYNIDDYRNYWPGREKLTPKIEYQAVAQANLTLCVAGYRARHLKQACPEQASQIVHIPHGCSPTFMVNHPLAKPNPLPAELKVYPRPIAGYIGTLGYRFDFHYLAQAVQKLPQVTFILGGPIPQPQDGSTDWWQDVEEIRQLPNVYWIGKVPHHRLGQYLQSFDVLLMCYSDCNFNRNACPTKLWDYMGTSRPVVANNVVPEVNQWSQMLHIATHPSDFAQKIELALAQPNWKASERLSIAKHHTWRHQAQKLYGLLQERKWLTTCR